MAADGDLLPAASGPEAEHAALRRLADGLVALSLPLPERQSTLLRALARELLAGYVLRPVLGFAAPFWINKLLLAALRSGTEAHGPPAPAPVPPPALRATHTLANATSAADADALPRLSMDAHGFWDGTPLAELDERRGQGDAASVAASASVGASGAASAYDDSGGDSDDDSSVGHSVTSAASSPSGRAAAAARLAASTGDVSTSSSLRSASLLRPSSSVELLDSLDLATPSAAEDGSAAVAPPPTGPVRPLRAGTMTARVIGSAVLGDAFSTHVSYEILVSDGAGARWLVQRRFSNFEALHKRLKALRARGRYKLPPKRILFHSTEGGFMDARKALLDRYLQDILADARLCASPEVWDFLSAHSRSYVPAPGGGGVLKSVSLGLSAGIDSAVEAVSSGVHAVKAELVDASRKLDRMKERREKAPQQQPGVARRATAPPAASVLGGAGALAVAQPVVSHDLASAEDSERPSYDTGSVARASAAAAAPSAARTLDAHAPGGDDARRASGAGASASASETLPPPREHEDPAGLSLPLLDLVDAVFRLRERGLVRRRMLSFARAVAELFIGGAVDDALASKLAHLRAEGTAAGLVRSIREALWPGGTWHRTRAVAEARAQGLEPPPTSPLGFGGVPPGREEEAREDARAVCALLLQRGGAGAAERLVGRDAFRRGALELYTLLQSPLFMRHVGHNLLEALLAALCPELHPVLLEVRTRAPRACEDGQRARVTDAIP